MRPSLGRNQAELFDDLLEGRTTEGPRDLTDLMAFANEVWALPAPEPRPDFSSALRRRLMTEAPSALAAGALNETARLTLQAPSRPPKRRNTLTTAIAALAMAGTATGTTYAAQNALPGSVLYPIKRLVESGERGLAMSDAAKGKASLDHAAERLAEAAGIIKAGDHERATKAIEEYVEQSSRGVGYLSDSGDTEEIEAFTTDQIAQMSTMADVLPTDLLKPVLTTLIGFEQATSANSPTGSSLLGNLPASLLSLVPILPNSALPGTATSAPQPGAPTPGTRPTPSATTGSMPAGSTPRPPSTIPTPSRPTTSVSKPGRPTATKPTTPGEVVGQLGDTVGNGVIGGVGGTLGGVGNSIGGPVGDAVSGVGSLVEGVGGTLGGLLSGVGGLLNLPTAHPTPTGPKTPTR